MNLRKAMAATAASALVFASACLPAFASSGPGITVAPFTYSAVGLGSFTATGGPAATAEWVDVGGNEELYLSKNVPTSEYAAAGAHITGVKGLPTDNLTLSFQLVGPDPYCGAGAPRFNVYLEGVSAPVFLGCADGTVDGSTVSFVAGGTYGGVSFPTGQTVEKIDVIQDEQGATYLDNITIDNVRHHVVATGPGNTRSQ